jgi:hypothetical protein
MVQIYCSREYISCIKSIYNLWLSLYLLKVIDEFEKNIINNIQWCLVHVVLFISIMFTYVITIFDRRPLWMISNEKHRPIILFLCRGAESQRYNHVCLQAYGVRQFSMYLLRFVYEYCINVGKHDTYK